jgi:tryptophan synthase alpha chain
MGELRERLSQLKAHGEKAIIPYIVAGFPDVETSLELVLQLQKRGASAIEIGIPFSDPMADGPVIQTAHAVALQRGVTPFLILEAIKERESQWEIPLIIMTYFNPVFRIGERRFAQMVKEAGISGAIIPDLPPEEAGEWIKASKDYHLDTVFLVAPNTPEERIKKIASLTTGFLYYLSLKGVTGSKIKDLEKVKERIRKIKDITSLPVCVGFGIRERWEVRTLLEEADGIIVGSSLLRALMEGGPSQMLELFMELQGAT